MLSVFKQGVFRHTECLSRVWGMSVRKMIGNDHGIQKTIQSTQVQPLCTLHSKVCSNKMTTGSEIILKTESLQNRRNCQTSGDNQMYKTTSFPSMNVMSIRNISNRKQYPSYYTYRHSAWKRIHKLGLEARLSSKSGKEILWRRFLKGRHKLTVFDRLLNHNPLRSNKEMKTARKLTKKVNYKI